MKFHIYGLFGGTNFGDELFSKYIVENILADDELETPYLFTNNESCSRENVPAFNAVSSYPLPNKGFGEWWKAFRSFSDSNGLLFGGGGLFNEVFLRAGIPSKAIILATAKLYGVPYIMHGVEIGYVGSRLNRMLTKWSLKNAERVICRNDTSVERARELYGVDIELGVDINQAWLNAQMSDQSNGSPQGEKPRFIVNLQHSLYLDDDFTYGLIENKRKEGYSIVFLITEEHEEDLVKEKFPDLIDETIIETTVDGTAAVLRTGDAFLTERFHFTMAALHANKPTIVIVSSTKVRELLEMVASKGALIETLRDDKSARGVRYIAGSPAQEKAVAEWGKSAEAQIITVLGLLKARGKQSSFSPQYIFPLIFFYAVLATYYLMDKVSPLRRHLDLSKT